jgi:DNA-binding winged helix-turn-helix (wHTH) protein/tetratricopeptide (TPR) repeat protein
MPGPVDHDYRFGEFGLDLRNERLWRGADALELRPKTYSVLSYLVQHAGELVSRETLLQVVWPGIAVTEAVLTGCIAEIRQALGDDPRSARYVATVHRRGYRFIANLAPAPLAPVRLVGRHAELRQLERCLETARRGERVVAFVTGEAGLGKTSLVDAFLERVGVGAGLWCARGQCIAHYGAGEAYLPVLDALSRLSREVGAPALKACLSRYAPTWLLQMPALVGSADEMDALQHRTVATGKSRMLRELAEALEALTLERPLILVLEDLHWSDYATLDLVSWLAQRHERARLLVVGTYRPVEVIVRDHPLQAVKQELTRHGRCVELPLELLTAAEVEQHLAARLGATPPLGAPLLDLAGTIHRRTDGHPLFMVTLVDALVQGGWLREHEDRWEVKAGIDAVAHEVPRSLQDLVEQQFQQLDAESQRLLEAASVVGLEGSAAAIAAGLAAEPTATEERCAALARRGQFLEASGEEEWPDGTVAGRYRFRHTLHRQVVYDRLRIGQRVQLHARIGERQERGHGAQVNEHASELAIHFEEGRKYERALHFRRQAADNATRRDAYQEAIGHLRRGLALLSRLPEAERPAAELPLRLALGRALSAVHGPAASAVGEEYLRAHALAQGGEATMSLAVVQGLRRYHLGRAEVRRARELGEEAVQVAERLGDPAQLTRAHAALGTCLFYLGELAAARDHLLVHGAAEGAPHRTWTTVTAADLTSDPLSRISTGGVLWLLGYPEQALTYTEAALALARELGSPLVQVSVLSHAAVVHQFRRDVSRTREHAALALRLASDRGFSLWAAHALILHGWALAMEGKGDEGIAQISRGLDAWRTNEQRLGQPYLLALLTEAYGRTGHARAGLDTVAQALAAVETYGLRMYESELYRLKGELLALAPTGSPREGEACIEHALELSRRQGAKGLELRAALSLNRMGQRRGRSGPARRVVREVYRWFTEGFDTADLQEAQALLREDPLTSG